MLLMGFRFDLVKNFLAKQVQRFNKQTKIELVDSM